MQQTTRIPLGNKFLARTMVLTEGEVRFFPKLAEMKSMLQAYNFNKCTKQELIERLTSFKEECVRDNLGIYTSGIDELISTVEYRY